MIKRTNKITALLVVAASIMSIVPAMAADSTRLGTKDGTVIDAVAFKDGKYVYRGYRTDDDNEGIYYNAGDKDKSLDDVEDADIKGAYDEKYAFANDGNDQYLIDLSAGTVSDEQTPEDNADTASTKLKTALKKSDRYGELTSITSSQLGYTDEDNTGALKGPKFAETWYQYAVSPITLQDNSVNVTASNTTGTLYGFTNGSGKYVDVSNLADIYAYSTTKGKMVKIEEYNDYDSDTKLTAELLGAPEVITQDADYIYAIVEVKITDADTNALAAGTTTAAAATATAGTSATTHKYLQKISKAQGDKKDDAYIPKSVASYELDNKSFIDNGDVEDAYYAIQDDDGFLKVDNQYRVKGDALYVTRIKEGSVKVFALKMTKIKENSVNAAIEAGGKLDAYVVKKTGDNDQDISDSLDDSNDETRPSLGVSIDVDGNTWSIDEGKIYKFTGTDKEVMFTCDRSLDKLSVYDDGSLIAWDGTDDGNVYTTVQEGTSVTDGETTPVAPVKVGWDKLTDGTWNFYDATGAKVVSNWANVGGVWYYLKADGVMATNWLNDNGTWYFLASSGGMNTGWLNDSGTWYYLQSSGAMKTGWLNDNGTWYYLNANGSMAANTTVQGYVLAASGAWVK